MKLKGLVSSSFAHQRELLSHLSCWLLSFTCPIREMKDKINKGLTRVLSRRGLGYSNRINNISGGVELFLRLLPVPTACKVHTVFGTFHPHSPTPAKTSKKYGGGVEKSLWLQNWGLGPLPFHNFKWCFSKQKERWLGTQFPQPITNAQMFCTQSDQPTQHVVKTWRRKMQMEVNLFCCPNMDITWIEYILRFVFCFFADTYCLI